MHLCSPCLLDAHQIFFAVLYNSFYLTDDVFTQQKQYDNMPEGGNTLQEEECPWIFNISLGLGEW